MSSTLSQQVKQHLLDSIQHMKAIRTCMLEEKKALETRDADLIQQLAQDKAALLKHIEADIVQRQHLLESQQLPVDDKGMQSLLDAFPDTVSDALHKGWKQLSSLHQEVQQLNLTNGIIINKGLQQVDMMLDMIRQNGDSQATGTYNAKGRAVSSSTRTLGQA